MSVRHMDLVWKHSQRSGSERLMLLALADYASDDGNNIYPSITALAVKCRMSARNVNHVLRALKASGELEVKRCDGPHGTNRYVIRIQTAPPLKPASPLKQPSAPDATFTPEAAFTLQPASSTPEAGVLKPLKPASPESLLNHQEPSEGSRKRGARNCPKSFVVTAELKAWAQDECPSVDLKSETAKFMDNTFKNLITDWPGAWKNWIRRTVEFAAQRTAQGRPAVSDDKPAWALAAGFRNRFEAENAGCYESNAATFHAGKPLPTDADTARSEVRV